jgi:hypothetical protein
VPSEAASGRARPSVVPIKPQIRRSALAAEGHGLDGKEIQKPTSAAEAAILGDASGTTEVMPFPNPWHELTLFEATLCWL